MKNTLGFLIESHGLEISTLARELGCSRSTIYRALKGKPCSGEFMLKVSSYFGKDVRDIFFTPNVQRIVQRKNKTA
jgi:DNA-binding XRE family transcriptional regulator